MARPTKYNDDRAGQVIDYLARWMEEDAVPSIEGLSDYIGINKSTIYEWESKYPEFSNALEKVRNRQARTLFNNGLRGDYNATIAKLMLHNHGYSDKQETTLSVKSPEEWLDELE